MSFDSIQDAVLIVGLDERVVHANRRAAEFFDLKLPPGDTTSELALYFERATNQPAFSEAWQHLRPTSPDTDRLRLEIQSPETRVLDVFTTPVRDQDRSIARL